MQPLTLKILSSYGSVHQIKFLDSSQIGRKHQAQNKMAILLTRISRCHDSQANASEISGRKWFPFLQYIFTEVKVYF
jgi:hypothetical protein